MPKTVEYTYHQYVKSEVINQVWYNLTHKTLYVQFNNGHYAGYVDVEPGVVDSLVNAPSVGSYYNSRIRGRYKGIDAPAGMQFKRTVYGKVSTPKPVAVAANANTSPYVVKGEVKQLVEANYSATDVNDAIKQFLADNPNATVTEVTVKF